MDPLKSKIEFQKVIDRVADSMKNYLISINDGEDELYSKFVDTLNSKLENLYSSSTKQVGAFSTTLCQPTSCENKIVCFSDGRVKGPPGKVFTLRLKHGIISMEGNHYIFRNCKCDLNFT